MNRVHELLIQGATTVNHFLQTADGSNIVGGIKKAWDIVMQNGVTVVNYVVVPGISVGVGIFLLIQIGGCVKKHNARQEYGDKLTAVAISGVILLLVSTWSLWGWPMVGVKTSTPQATNTVVETTSVVSFLGGTLL